MFTITMKTSRLCNCILLVALLIWVSITISRPLAPSDAPTQQDQTPNENPKGATLDSEQGVAEKSYGGGGAGEKYEGEEFFRGLKSRLGSMPPNCAHRCEGCVPCAPVQIPTNTDRIQVQYANYEPEGWKCKCGSAFFSP